MEKMAIADHIQAIIDTSARLGNGAHVNLGGWGMTIKDGFKFGLGFMFAGILFRLAYEIVGLLIKLVTLGFGGVAA